MPAPSPVRSPACVPDQGPHRVLLGGAGPLFEWAHGVDLGTLEGDEPRAVLGSRSSSEGRHSRNVGLCVDRGACPRSSFLPPGSRTAPRGRDQASSRGPSPARGDRRALLPPHAASTRLPNRQSGGECGSSHRLHSTSASRSLGRSRSRAPGLGSASPRHADGGGNQRGSGCNSPVSDPLFAVRTSLRSPRLHGYGHHCRVSTLETRLPNPMDRHRFYVGGFSRTRVPRDHAHACSRHSRSDGGVPCDKDQSPGGGCHQGGSSGRADPPDPLFGCVGSQLSCAASFWERLPGWIGVRPFRAILDDRRTHRRIRRRGHEPNPTLGARGRRLLFVARIHGQKRPRGLPMSGRPFYSAAFCLPWSIR